MNNLCTRSAIVLLQDLMPLMTSKDICPGTRLTHYYQSWWLGHEITLTAQRNTVDHKKGFPKNPHIFLHPKTAEARQSANLMGVDSHKSIGLRWSFIPNGWNAQRNQRTGCPYQRKWWDTLVSPLCKDFPMWMVLSHYWLRKNRGERPPQTQLMMTTNWRFSWKHNAVEYQWDTVTNPRVECQGLWLQHNYMHKYLLMGMVKCQNFGIWGPEKKLGLQDWLYLFRTYVRT
jgi:hypothetical protein